MIHEHFLSQNRKIILLLDNAGPHNNLEFSNIELFFLPKNTTPILQPLDFGVIKSFKDHYSTSLIDFICFTDDQEFFIESPKKINLRQVLLLISDAWTEVSSETIINYWDKVFSEHQSEDLNGHSIDEKIEKAIEYVLDENDSDPERIFYDGISAEQVTIKTAIDNINKVEEKVNMLLDCLNMLPDCPKDFYDFRKKFMRKLKFKYGYGQKITYYFKQC